MMAHPVGSSAGSPETVTWSELNNLTTLTIKSKAFHTDKPIEDLEPTTGENPIASDFPIPC